MKKLVLNLSDCNYEKFCLEALEQNKDISTIISERILYKPFSDETEKAFDSKMKKDLDKLLNGGM